MIFHPSYKRPFVSAEEVIAILESMPGQEREKFFAILASKAFSVQENFGHAEVFGNLDDAQFSATEAAQYLEVSIATFRRYVHDGRIKACVEVGSSHLYALADLREMKQALHLVK